MGRFNNVCANKRLASRMESEESSDDEEKKELEGPEVSVKVNERNPPAGASVSGSREAPLRVDESSDEEDQSSDEEEQDENNTMGRSSGSRETPLLGETRKDDFALNNLQHWHACRDHMANKEPKGADAKRELILLLKRWLPKEEFNRAHTLVHGVCVPADPNHDSNPAAASNETEVTTPLNDGKPHAAIRTKDGYGNSTEGKNNNIKSYNYNIAAGNHPVAQKRHCLDTVQTPLEEATWGARKQQPATWGARKKQPADNSMWGTPAPTVIARWVRTTTLPAQQNMGDKQQRQIYSNHNGHLNNYHHQSRHYSHRYNDNWPNHSPQRNSLYHNHQHQQHCPDSNH